jgi:hypothetical protein
MMRVSKLRRRPSHFLRFCGVSVAQFDSLLTSVERAAPAYHVQRLARPTRHRAIGGGGQFRLSTADQLLLLLVWLRLYLTNDLLGYLFGLDASNISRNRHLMLPLLEQHLPAPMQTRRQRPGRAPAGAPRRRKKIATLDELFTQYPGLKEVIVDALEQPVQRPREKRAQKRHYSGKKQRHTRKTQLTTLTNGMITHLSKSVPGRVHDYKLFHRSGVERVLPEGYGLRVDLGYLGIVKDYPHRRVSIPTRASKLHPLTRAEKRRNRVLARARVAVEHTIGWLKKYQVLGQVYRHALSGYDLIIRTVCGLVTLRMQERLSAAA